MRVAVLSDIHANVHALEAVLADVAGEEPDEVWCLGDIVGYGPEPNGCCELVRGRAALSLAGNHDLAVLGTLRLAEFNNDAAAAARWTQDVLSDESRAFLARSTRCGTTCSASTVRGGASPPSPSRFCSSGTATSRSA
jgi:predicted phosphodiesterase